MTTTQRTILACMTMNVEQAPTKAARADAQARRDGYHNRVTRRERVSDSFYEQFINRLTRK
jgi:hypothetical protein